jgi:protein TonB
MRDFAFAEARPQLVPAHKRSTLVIAVVLLALAIAVLIQVKSQPERVVSEGAPQGSITVYLPAPPAAAPAAAAKPPEAKMALKTEPVKEEVQPDTTAGSAGVIGAEPTPSGPVRLGSGGSVTLLRKVQPVYPPMMRSARITGQVVLDAIIHADGTIGDVTVLQSSNPAFTRSAVDAVKQWRYQPIGYEAILTVSVSFTLT